MDDTGVIVTSLVLSSTACLMPLLAGAFAIVLKRSPVLLRYHFLGPMCEMEGGSKDELMSYFLLMLDWLVMTAAAGATLFFLAYISEVLVSIHFILKHLR